MRISQVGIDLIKHFEGLRLEPYQDSIGRWTIGYGHTGEGVENLGKITEEAAEFLLRQDLERFEDGVTGLLAYDVEQNEFDALVSLAFNIGLKNFENSTLLKMINDGDQTIETESQQFLRWNHAGGHVLPGLTNRREAEAALFRGAK